jgi:hypothetical protein
MHLDACSSTGLMPCMTPVAQFLHLRSCLMDVQAVTEAKQCFDSMNVVYPLRWGSGSIHATPYGARMVLLDAVKHSV